MAHWKMELRRNGIRVEALTTAKDGSTFGYRFASDTAGPQIVVAGTCETSELIVRRLMSIRTLPWVRGTLVLVRLDILDCMLGNLGNVSPLGEIDRVIVLPWIKSDATNKTPRRRAYRMVLRACIDLGLVSRRELPDRLAPVLARQAG